jgi:hypothetical protein
MLNCRWETVSAIIEIPPVGAIFLSFSSHIPFHKAGIASKSLLK